MKLIPPVMMYEPNPKAIQCHLCGLVFYSRMSWKRHRPTFNFCMSPPALLEAGWHKRHGQWQLPRLHPDQPVITVDP